MSAFRRFVPLSALLLAPLVGAGPGATAAETTPRVIARTVAAFTDVTDSAGQTWKARTGLIGGSTNSTALIGKDVLGTTDDALYQSSTYTSTGYAVAVPAGRYRVRLLMADGYWTKAGQRLFDVTAEGVTALSRVDIVGAAGRGTAYDRTFEVDVTDGRLDLGFVKVVDNPLVAAVEVTYVGPVGGTTGTTPNTPSAPTGTPTTSQPTTNSSTTPATSAPTMSAPTTSNPPTVPPTTSQPTTSAPTTSSVPTVPTTTSQPTTSAPTTSSVPTVPTTTAQPTSSAPATGPVPTATPTTPAPTPTTTPAPAPTTTAAPLISDGKAPVTVASGSPWVTRIENAPLDPNSAAMAANIRADVVNNWGGIAAVNSYQYNTSFYEVPADQPRIDVNFVDCQNKRWVDPNLFTGPAYFKGVPIPDDAQPANGTDAELTIYDPAADQIWEFWQARRNALSGQWEACWGGRVDNLSANMGLFPRYYGATGSGVVMAAGMIGIDEVRRGSIDHALYLGVMNSQSYPAMSWPALRTDGNLADPNVVREGQRLRLDPSIDLSRYDLTPFGRMVATAAQKYGFVVSDRAGAVAVITESGQRERARTGTDPWAALLGRWQPYDVLRNFPWESLQVVEADWGRPADVAAGATKAPTSGVSAVPAQPVKPKGTGRPTPRSRGGR